MCQLQRFVRRNLYGAIEHKVVATAIAGPPTYMRDMFHRTCPQDKLLLA